MNIGFVLDEDGVLQRPLQFEGYQEQAMSTNHWPLVFTEQQVRHMLKVTIEAGWMGELDAEAGWQPWIDNVIKLNTTSLNRLIYQVLGLCGEAGEISEKVKKTLRDRDGKLHLENEEDIALESGDALWYITAIAGAMNWTLSRVAKANLIKLADRAKRGVLRGDGDKR